MSVFPNREGTIKMFYTTNAQAHSLHWERGLGPSIVAKMGIGDGGHGRPQDVIIVLQHWGEENG